MAALSPKGAAIGVAAFRVAYGVALTAAPARLGRRWLGADAAATDPVQVGLRGLGARDAVINAGALVSALRGAPVRPWLAAAIAGDVADLAATLAGRRGLPDGSPALAAAVIAGSIALTGAALAAQDA
jgi:hypothetical protein